MSAAQDAQDVIEISSDLSVSVIEISSTSESTQEGSKYVKPGKRSGLGFLLGKKTYHCFCTSIQRYKTFTIRSPIEDADQRQNLHPHTVKFNSELTQAHSSNMGSESRHLRFMFRGLAIDATAE